MKRIVLSLVTLISLNSSSLFAANALTTDRACKKICSKYFDPAQCMEMCTSLGMETSAGPFEWDMVVQVDEYCMAFHHVQTGEWDLACFE